jgi:hypothetical protein
MNYLENKVSLTSASRRRLIPVDGTTIGEKASKLHAPNLVK